MVTCIRIISYMDGIMSNMGFTMDDIYDNMTYSDIPSSAVKKDPNILGEFFNKQNDKYIVYLNEDDKKADQPKDFGKVKLRPHQLTSLQKLLDFDINKGWQDDGWKLHSNWCIYGDPPGYGKTLNLIAYMIEVRNRKLGKDDICLSLGAKTDNLVCDLYQKTGKELKFVKKTLVIVPPTVLDQWEKEFNSVGIKRHEGKKKQKEDTYMHNQKNKKLLRKGRGILLYSSGEFKTLWGNLKSNKMNRYLFERCIIDEADSIKIPGMPSINALYTVFVTATANLGGIMRVTNMGWLKNNFKDMNPIAYCKSIVACSEEYCTDSCKMVTPKKKIIKCASPSVIDVVSEHLTAEQMEMLNEGNTNGVIESLGGMVKTDRNIIELVTNKYRDQIMERTARLEYIKAKPYKDADSKQESIKKCEEEIAGFQTRIDSITKRIEDVKKGECSICRSVLVGATMTPCCNQLFCGQCLITAMQYKKDACPLCREKISVKELMAFSDPLTTAINGLICEIVYDFCDYAGFTREWGFQYLSSRGYATAKKKEKEELPSKQESLIKLLKKLYKNKENRVMVFYTDEHVMDQVGIDYEVVRGKTRKQKERFRDGDTRVMLMKNVVAGMECPWVTHMVFYRKPSPREDKQALGRALRMSRKKDLKLRAYYLYYENEMV